MWQHLIFLSGAAIHLIPELSPNYHLLAQFLISAWLLLSLGQWGLGSSAPVSICRLPEPGGWGAPPPLVRGGSPSTSGPTWQLILGWCHLLGHVWIHFSHLDIVHGLLGFLQSCLSVANILTFSWPGAWVLFVKTRKGDNSGMDSGRHFKEQGRSELEVGGSCCTGRSPGSEQKGQGFRAGQIGFESPGWLWSSLWPRGSFLISLSFSLPSCKSCSLS